MGVGLTNIFASTVDEFTDNAANIFGAGTLGQTNAHVSAKWTLDQNSKIASAALSLSITSTTAHWAGSRYYGASATGFLAARSPHFRG